MNPMIVTMTEEKTFDTPFQFYIPARSVDAFQKAVSVWENKKSFLDVKDILFFMPDEDIMGLSSHSHTLSEYKKIISKNLLSGITLEKKSPCETTGVKKNEKVRYFSRVYFEGCTGRVIKKFLLWAKIGYYNKITSKLGEKWVRKSKLKIL